MTAPRPNRFVQRGATPSGARGRGQPNLRVAESLGEPSRYTFLLSRLASRSRA